MKASCGRTATPRWCGSSIPTRGSSGPRSRWRTAAPRPTATWRSPRGRHRGRRAAGFPGAAAPPPAGCCRQAACRAPGRARRWRDRSLHGRCRQRLRVRACRRSGADRARVAGGTGTRPGPAGPVAVDPTGGVDRHGIAHDDAEARTVAAVPIIGFVAPPTDALTLSGDRSRRRRSI